MLASRLLAPTLREVPAEAEIVSHQLLLRAGFIRKSTSGVYTLLPLGYRVVTKIMQIVREEMDAAGGQEIGLPIIQPAELWLESGRWHVYGDELFRLKDRHNRDFCLGPTHEEIITDLVRKEVSSYKQLPLLLYQIQNKYRDERRPRFGLMRSREFIMKDLYSFDRDEAGLEVSYQKMFDAYTNVFTRCGLRFRPVEADSGAIGGSSTHEFVVLAGSGEAEIVYCTSCDYAANVERGEAVVEEVMPGALHEVEKVATPGIKTIEQVSSFLQVSPRECLKTLIYLADGKPVAVVVRGDREVNEIKLKNKLGCLALELAPDTQVKELTGVSAGSLGPVGLKGIPVYLDEEAAGIVNGVAGANEEDYHLKHVNYPRDYAVELVGDFRTVRAGDKCPKCHGELASARGIEVGQIFKLGTKYSKAMEATFLDEQGQKRYMVMGCYGIGITRTMAAAVEQNYDEHGIIWPLSIAPFHVVIVPASNKEERQVEIAGEIYRRLTAHGIEVVLDDRNERAGVKFADADLIGYPLRVTVGKKTVSEGTVDIKMRRDGQEVTVKVDEVTDWIQSFMAEEV
ncbi:MAG TPA: proline--tRNA ligase [Clostridia bacterium]|nr:proline--tRNA ligase [Clostridia bacterium]